MKKFLKSREYYYILYNKSFGIGGQEGRGFYYQNKKKNLYLRFSFFKVGNLIVLVSSQHSPKKIKKLLSKPKPLLINRCCGFRVLETEFQPSDKDLGKQHFQISHDKGKTYFDYEIGSNKKIDSFFENTDVRNIKESNWVAYDFAEILDPHFGIIEVTNEHKLGAFKLDRF